MKLSVILTIHNRSPEVSQQVADSFKLPGNEFDELVVVLDRPTDEARQGAMKAYSPLKAKGAGKKHHSIPSGWDRGPSKPLEDSGVHFTTIGIGEPGWKGPAKAWNRGFQQATGDLLYCISSEVVQEEGNIDKARKAAESGNVIFGSCHNSTREALVVGAEPGLLVSSKMPRPLGFIVCMPAANVKTINGFDEDFMKGFWFDDDDFFLRLWNSGVDFQFEDSIHGTHLDHTRPGLETQEGQAKIARNRELMTQKHGNYNVWPNLDRIEHYTEGRRIWRHA